MLSGGLWWAGGELTDINSWPPGCRERERGCERQTEVGRERGGRGETEQVERGRRVQEERERNDERGKR